MLQTRFIVLRPISGYSKLGNTKSTLRDQGITDHFDRVHSRAAKNVLWSSLVDPQRTATPWLDFERRVA
jgi:hypothetical protein